MGVKVNKIKPKHNYLGAVGEKIKDIKVKVLNIEPYPHKYGVSFIISMEDNHNNKVVWIASKNPFKDLDIGKNESTVSKKLPMIKSGNYLLQGRIKELTVKDLESITIMTKCKLDLRKNKKVGGIYVYSN